MLDVLRNMLWERDGGLCGICGDSVDRFMMHIDHVIPTAVGGPNCFDNLQPAHPRCNMRKGAGPNWSSRRRAVSVTGYSSTDLTISQVAEYLQVSIDTIRRWCRTGTLKCIALGDRAGYRIRQEDIDAFLQERGK